LVGLGGIFFKGGFYPFGNPQGVFERWGIPGGVHKLGFTFLTKLGGC